MTNTATIQTPRGFTLTGSDNFGPNRFMKKGARRTWLIRTARAETGAFSTVSTGWQLYLSTDRGWVARSGIAASPCKAWSSRSK